MNALETIPIVPPSVPTTVHSVYSIVAPVRTEAETLPRFYERVVTVMGPVG